MACMASIAIGKRFLFAWPVLLSAVDLNGYGNVNPVNGIHFARPRTGHNTRTGLGQHEHWVGAPITHGVMNKVSSVTRGLPAHRATIINPVSVLITSLQRPARAKLMCCLRRWRHNRRRRWRQRRRHGGRRRTPPPVPCHLSTIDHTSIRKWAHLFVRIIEKMPMFT